MLTIQSLNGNHDRKKFDCGGNELNDWLQRVARQHQERDISQTFVAVDPDHPRTILGYYALSACDVSTDNFPPEIAKKLPRRVPGIRLGRLAVDLSLQRQGLGEHLLMNAMNRACQLRGHVGLFALFVDAKDQDAASFYAKYGFVALRDAPFQLVLPLARVCGKGNWQPGDDEKDGIGGG